jgi:TonB family protein
MDLNLTINADGDAAGYLTRLGLMRTFLATLLVAYCGTCCGQQASAPRLSQPHELAQIAAVRSRIVRNLIVEDSVPASAQAEVQIEFSEDGSIRSLTLLRASGYESYDRAIEQAVYKSAPFELTPGIGKDGKAIRIIVFHFHRGA